MHGMRLFVFLAAGIAPALGAQQRDSAAVEPEHYVIDVPTLVREQGARTLTDVLISQVPGLLVIPGSGLNGGGSRIRFAGVRTLVDDQAPLVFVDGIRVDQAEDAYTGPQWGAGAAPLRLEDFSVEDIAAIDVFPPSGALTIYGPGSSNGVIAIRTKLGRSGALRWEGYARAALSAEHGDWPTNYGGVDLDNPNLLLRNGGCTLVEEAYHSCVQDYVQSFNPLVQRSPFGAALAPRVGGSASGGPSWGAVRLSGDIEGSGGPYDVPGLAVDPNSARRTHVAASAGAWRTSTLGTTVHLGYLFSELRTPIGQPLSGATDSTGFSWEPSLASFRRQEVGRTTAAVEAHWSPRPWATAHGLTGWDNVDQRDDGTAPYSSIPEAFRGRRQVRKWTARIDASVSADLRRHLHAAATVGVERRSDRAATDVLTCSPDCGAPTVWDRETRILQQRSLGYYFQGTASVRERLAVTAVLRHDRFDDVRQAVTHRSLTALWKARRDSAAWVGRVTVHAAIGRAGLPPNTALDTVFFLANPFLPPPPIIRPEETRSIEVGTDVGLVHGTWDARLTLYDQRSRVVSPVLSFSPYGGVSPYAPGGEITNRGVWASFAGALIRSTAMTWNLRLSLWGNRNRLTTLPNSPWYVRGSPPTMQINEPGVPVGGYQPFTTLGYADSNGDGILTYNEVASGPTRWVGTPYPTQGAALTSAWHVRGRVHVAATLEYRAGQVLFNEAAWGRCATSLARCREANDPSTPLAAQVYASGAVNGPVPMHYFEDADYLKLREVSLTFDVPRRTAAALGARAASVAIAGRNLGMWTRYSGLDPESGSYGVVTPGETPQIADYGALPPPRVWSLRVQLQY